MGYLPRSPEYLEEIRLGVEKDTIDENWLPYYCGSRIWEQRYIFNSTTAYKPMGTAGDWHYIYIPMRHMFKLIKFEFKHTDASDLDTTSMRFLFHIKRSIEMPQPPVTKLWLAGHDVLMHDWVELFPEQFVFPPLELELGLMSNYDDSRVRITFTYQIMR